MKSNEFVQDNMPTVSSIVNLMKSHGENISDELVVAKVLGSLTKKFKHVVGAI